MRDIAPITRQRLLIEGRYGIDLDEPKVEAYLHGLAAHLDLRTYGRGAIFAAASHHLNAAPADARLESDRGIRWLRSPRWATEVRLWPGVGGIRWWPTPRWPWPAGGGADLVPRGHRGGPVDPAGLPAA